MSKPSDKQIEEAFQILGRYERALTEKMAAEIIEQQEDFESPFVGGAEQLIDKYYHLLACLCRVRSSLYGYLPKEQRRAAPRNDKPLGKDEFRCFRCRSIIIADADSCPECGWTWG
ncbi:MAG TPA: hypothetical protein VN281_11650 [Verrucomicrobiae bacterium]|jgi:hypothetical protein|nr:hypothetical protein [Verrucomicrobiae bacterium]